MKLKKLDKKDKDIILNFGSIKKKEKKVKKIPWLWLLVAAGIAAGAIFVGWTMMIQYDPCSVTETMDFTPWIQIFHPGMVGGYYPLYLLSGAIFLFVAVSVGSLIFWAAWMIFTIFVMLPCQMACESVMSWLYSWGEIQHV